MRHHRAVRPTMPMRLAAGNVHDIPDLQTLWLLPFAADEAGAHCHRQYLQTR